MSDPQDRPMPATRPGGVPADGELPEGWVLDGEWAFRVGPAPAGCDPTVTPGDARIVVPGLWEAQGWLDLDGEAWYHRTVGLADAGGFWSLRFGAVMDAAEVYVNGRRAGEHLGGYTPFEVDVTGLVRAGRNDVAVRVVDHPLDGWDHVRTAHGKQGWMNHVFPSPPSLYMTYGGIWQPVTLHRHGGVRVADVFVDGAPGDLRVTVTLANDRREDVTTRLRWSLPGRDGGEDVDVPAGGAATVAVVVPGHGLAHWSPRSPRLHEVTVGVEVAGERSDETTTRFGVRRVELAGDRLLLDGEPVRIMAALVQGFRPDTLYAEGTRGQVRAEVAAAKAAGFNTLRLHIKAFDPVYLDVCDELGMLVHCDVPVAEPIAHGELGASGVVADRAAAAAAEQVRRDRNHPSVVLWSAMNELGAEHLPARTSAGYEGFARRLYGAVVAADGTRPVIENDWIEPDPETVFLSPILTAHWYGRLSARYLESLWAKLRRTATGARPFLLSEFGDWGLPALEPPAAGAFWAPDHLADSITRLAWPRDAASFVRGTQAYQGLADRIQIEMCRATSGVGGWCLTELTDVPHEYNGLWQFDRTPKGPALAVVAGAMRPTLPIAVPVHAGRFPDVAYRGSWTGWAGEAFAVRVLVAHDEPGTPDVVVRVSVGGRVVSEVAGRLPAHAPFDLGEVVVPLPAEPGRCSLELVVDGAGPQALVNRYEVHVLERPAGDRQVRLAGSPADAAALAAAGLRVDDERGPLVVGEGALSGAVAGFVVEELDAGHAVLVLAQPAGALAHLPVALTAVDVATEWGSTPFLYTGDEPVLRAAEPGTVLTTELLTVVPDVVVRSTLPGLRTAVGMYKPFPDEIDGVAVGSVPVGAGRLWLCQLPVVAAAAQDDPTAVRVLADLVAAVGEEGVGTRVAAAPEGERGAG